MPKRCILGCLPSVVPMHRFPNAVKFPEKFKAWVSLVGGKLETSSDFEYYKERRICDRHFSDNHKNRNKRLSALAVPMFHLPEQLRATEALEPASTSDQPLQPTMSQPDTTEQLRATEALEPASTSDQPLQPTMSQPDTTGQLAESTSTKYLDIANSSDQPTTTDLSNNTTLNRVMLEHNYSAITRSRRTPKEDSMAPLRTKIKQLRSEISRLRKKGQSFMARLKNAEDFSKKNIFQHLAKNLKKPALLFLSMQMQSSKCPKGRRFSTEEKVLSLSLYKKSPKCYGLLNKMFTLPSTKAMKRMLSTIKISPGINPIIFERIKQTLRDKNIDDRLFSLIFDEMSLTPQINYNAQTDVFHGFASNKKNNFADHVLVFMVKGVKGNFKQPIAYYFTAGLNKVELKNLIKEVIKYAHKSGMIIINTVCDQSTINVGAITDLVNETKAQYMRLGKEWRYDHIIINKQKIIPIFDVPHLIKGIRNNLLTKDLVYTKNNVEKVVKWEYYQKVYAADKSYGELRLLNKITEEHIVPEKISKMRVKSATQIFSHSVAVATEHLTARGDLPQDCKQLIDITLLLDNLFDSLNVSTFHTPNGKIYKGPIKKNSPHHELWRDAKFVLKTVKFRFVKKTGNNTRLVETIIPSLTNLIKTIEGMEAIWKIVSEKYGFDTLLTRNFNQDPVENFFGNIRSYGGRNNSPNTIAFEGAFKALLLNNYNSPHSARANCEEDSNKCLQTLEFFFTEKSNSIPETSDVPMEEEIECNEDVFNVFNMNRETDAGQSNYVCGWVLTKCLKNIVKTCETCRQTLIDRSDRSCNSFIKAKEYSNKKWLCYPSVDLEKCFHDLQNITTAFLKKNVPKKKIKHNILAVANTMVDYPFYCTRHKENLLKYFNNVTINVILYSWCRSTNRILSGKLTYVGDDETKMAAQQYYNKMKNYKNKK